MENQKSSSPFDPEQQLQSVAAKFIVHIGEQHFIFDGPYRFHRDMDWVVVHKVRQAIYNPIKPDDKPVISWKEVALFFRPDCVIAE